MRLLTVFLCFLVAGCGDDPRIVGSPTCHAILQGLGRSQHEIYCCCDVPEVSPPPECNDISFDICIAGHPDLAHPPSADLAFPGDLSFCGANPGTFSIGQPVFFWHVNGPEPMSHANYPPDFTSEVNDAVTDCQGINSAALGWANQVVMNKRNGTDADSAIQHVVIYTEYYNPVGFTPLMKPQPLPIFIDEWFYLPVYDTHWQFDCLHTRQGALTVHRIAHYQNLVVGKQEALEAEIGAALPDIPNGHSGQFLTSLNIGSQAKNNVYYLFKKCSGLYWTVDYDDNEAISTGDGGAPPPYHHFTPENLFCSPNKSSCAVVYHNAGNGHQETTYEE